MCDVKFSSSKGLTKFWLKCESSLTIQVFSNPCLVLWRLYDYWSNRLNIIRGFHFRVSHIFREGNHYENKLANHGFKTTNAAWFLNGPCLPFSLYLLFLSTLFSPSPGFIPLWFYL